MKMIIVVLIGIILISFASIFIKFCENVPSIIIVAYRITISSALLILISLHKKNTGLALNNFDWQCRKFFIRSFLKRIEVKIFKGR